MRPSTLLLRVLVRSAALCGFFLLYQSGANARWWGFENDGGLGTGLLGFAMLLVLAGGWALVDGVRHGLPTALVWLAVAVVGGVATGTGSTLLIDTPASVLLRESALSSLVFAQLIGFGGVIGALIGGGVHALRHRQKPPVTG